MKTTKHLVMAGLVVFSQVAAASAYSATVRPALTQPAPVPVRPKTAYISGQLGLYQPTSDLDNGDYDTGFNGAVAFGFHLTPTIIAETMIDYIGADADSESYNEAIGHYDQDSTISATGFLFSLKGEVPSGPFRFYGGAGVGLYVANLSIEVDSSRFGRFEKEDDSDVTFGGHVIAGASYNITREFFVGIEGRYRWTGDVEVADTVAEVPVAYGGDLSGFTLSGVFGFRF